MLDRESGASHILASSRVSAIRVFPTVEVPSPKVRFSDAPFSSSSCAPRRSSLPRYVQSKSTAPICDGHSDGINTTLRSKPRFPPPPRLQKPHDRPRDHWSPGFPGRAAASDSTSRNNQAFAMPPLRQTTRRSPCPRIGVPTWAPLIRQDQRALASFQVLSAPVRTLGRTSSPRSSAPSI